MMAIYLLGVRGKSTYMDQNMSEQDIHILNSTFTLYTMHKASGQIQVNHCNLYCTEIILQENYYEGLV